MREIPDSAVLASAVFLHKQSDPASQVAQLSISLGEPVAVESIKEAWDAIARATPVLHSTFTRSADGEASFREAEPQGLRWTDLDWTAKAPAEVGPAWTALLEQGLANPISTSEPPLLHGTTIALPGGFTHLLLTFPRFLLTEDAVFRLVSRWLAALEGQSVESAGPLLAETADQATTDWWRKYLAGNVGPVALHIYPKSEDAPQPARQKSTLFTREQSRQVYDLAEKLQVSPRTLFLGLTAILFGRLGGTTDALLLDASALLPVRLTLKANASLPTWLTSVEIAENDRLAHSSLSLPHVLRLGNIPASTEFPIAFQWSPSLLNDRIHDSFPRWINADVKLMRQPIAPLTFEVREATRFQIDLYFAPSEFSEDQVETLFERFLQVLDAVLEDSSRKITEIDLLTEAERSSTSPGKNTPGAATAKPVADRIAETAARQPDDLAIRGEGDVGLSYSEVTSHAQSLAAYLRQENIADGWVVAACLTPTPWVPVVLLGVMEAGDTCVPLDPNASPAWLAEKAAACDAETIICDSQTAQHFQGSTRRILVIDRQWEEISAVPVIKVPSTVPKIAFVLTGGEYDAEPALKILSPQTVSTACKESAARWRLKTGDHVPLLPSAGSGAYVETILGSLAAGATLILPAPSTISLASLHGSTHLRLTLAQWRHLVLELKSGAQSLPESVRAVCIAARSLPTNVLATWREFVGEHVTTHLFWSPADLAGLSIRSSFKGQAATDAVPIGAPTPGLSVEFNDGCGKEIPPHYAGGFDVTFLEDNAHKWKLRAWRNQDGLFHLVDEPPSHLPGVLDYHLEEVPGEPRALLGLWVILSDGGTAISPDLKQKLEGLLHVRPDFILPVESFPLTPGGNVDSSNLPRPVVTTKPTAPVRASAPSPKPTAPAAEWAPLQFVSKTEDCPILLLVHDVDGDPAKYESLAKLLKVDWTLHATVARGLRNPSACHQTVESEAAAFVEALCSLDPVGPYHLLGHSYGAILAYEMARQLRRAGRSVNYLALVGSQPPALSSGKSWLKPFTRFFGGNAKKDTSVSTPVAQAHVQARENYQAEILEGPAGIILGSDISPESEESWLTAVPEAMIERMSGPSDQMLQEPAVKRLGVILSEWAEGAAEEDQ